MSSKICRVIGSVCHLSCGNVGLKVCLLCFSPCKHAFALKILLADEMRTAPEIKQILQITFR